MQFRFEWLPATPGTVRLKCFYGEDPNPVEFYLVIYPDLGVGEFVPKEGYRAEVLIQAFAEAMVGK